MSDRKIQSGVIQTIIQPNGRLSHYKLNLWVPVEYATAVGFLDIANIKNKYLYCPQSSDFESLMKLMNDAQLAIVDIKLNKLKQRKAILYNRRLKSKV